MIMFTYVYGHRMKFCASYCDISERSGLYLINQLKVGRLCVASSNSRTFCGAGSFV